MKVGMAGVNTKPGGVDADQIEDAIVSPARRGPQFICPSNSSLGAIGSHTIMYLLSVELLIFFLATYSLTVFRLEL